MLSIRRGGLSSTAASPAIRQLARFQGKLNAAKHETANQHMAPSHFFRSEKFQNDRSGRKLPFIFLPGAPSGHQ